MPAARCAAQGGELALHWSSSLICISDVVPHWQRLEQTVTEGALAVAGPPRRRCKRSGHRTRRVRPQARALIGSSTLFLTASMSCAEP